jgi:transposase-like protein
MRRKIEDEREARRCLKSARAAGLTAGEWAREHGIDGRSLNAWRINLSRSVTNELETPTPLRLVELVPAPTARDDARYLVRVRDLAIELGPDFDDETLVRIVRALRSC